MRNILITSFIFFIFITFSVLVTTHTLFAETTAKDLRTKITGNKGKIQKIEGDIKKYEKELTKVRGKKRTLQSSIKELDLSRRKTLSSINLTESKITSTKKKILTLSGQIERYINKIKSNTAGLAESFRRMYEVESVSLIELLLLHDSMASVWVAADSLTQFESVVSNKVDSLEKSQAELESTKDLSEEEKRRLAAEKDELSSAKLTLDINRSAKNKLLKVTKNKEGEYQRLLRAKRLAKKQFESELLAFESRLKYILDKSKLPTGKGVFSWPVANPRITQYFGKTKFAKGGAYNGKGHNGIDLGVVVGTRVNVAAGGSVIEVGNTDAYKGCYSYGKWVLIDHKNGLATLYAHLSKISVSTGQVVSAGQRIAYSGNTGYSTGPHLHFSTFASDAVRVVRMGDVKARTNCKNARVPISPTKGYLNPLDYI